MRTLSNVELERILKTAFGNQEEGFVVEFRGKIAFPDSPVTVFKNGKPGHFVLVQVANSDQTLSTVASVVMVKKFEDVEYLLRTSLNDIADKDDPDLQFTRVYIATEAQMVGLSECIKESSIPKLELIEFPSN